MWENDFKTKKKHTIYKWESSIMYACMQFLHTKKLLFPAVPHKNSRGGCSLMVATDWRWNINSHLFGNFQMFLSKVHGLLMIPQGGVGIS